MKKIITYINKLIQSNTKESSIRAGMIFTIGVVSISILSIVSALTYAIIADKHPDLVGASAFIVSLSTMYGVAVFGKIQQKKIESTGIQNKVDPNLPSGPEVG